MFARFLQNYPDQTFTRRICSRVNNARIVIFAPAQETFQPLFLPDGECPNRAVINAVSDCLQIFLASPLVPMMTIDAFVMTSIPVWSLCPRRRWPRKGKQLAGWRNHDLSFYIEFSLNCVLNLSVSCTSSTQLRKQIIFAPDDNISLSKICMLLLSLFHLSCITNNSNLVIDRSALLLLILGIIL